MRTSKKGLGEVRITGVKPTIREQIDNIASHTGIPYSKMLRPTLETFIKSYPEHMRAQPKKDF